MENKRRFGPKGLLACSILATTILALLAVEVNAQNQTVEVLAQRLKQRGVQLKGVFVLSRVPFGIEIDVQSQGSAQERSPDDIWSEQLARREATLAYRYGLEIEKYKLTLVNANGDVLNSQQINLSQTDSSHQPVSLSPSKLGNQATADLVRGQLDLHGLSLDQLQVSSDPIPGETGQSVLIQLSSPDLTAANIAIPPLLSNFHAFIETLNSKYGTRIVLIWIKILDSTGRILVNYVWDVETHEETSTQTPGVVEWYPHPAAPSQPCSILLPCPTLPRPGQTSIPTSTPTPLCPLCILTPTPPPYP